MLSFLITSVLRFALLPFYRRFEIKKVAKQETNYLKHIFFSLFFYLSACTTTIISVGNIFLHFQKNKKTCVRVSKNLLLKNFVSISWERMYKWKFCMLIFCYIPEPLLLSTVNQFNKTV